MRLFVLTVIFLSLAAVVSAQVKDGPDAAAESPVNGIEDVYLAKDDGNGKAGDPVSSFITTDIPIYCVVKLVSSKPATVKMNFVAVSVSGVKPDSKVVSVSYSTKAGQNRVNFTGRPDDKWNAGKYRVDIFIDGKLAKDLVFDIRSVKAADAASYFQPKPDPRSKAPARPKKIQ